MHSSLEMRMSPLVVLCGAEDTPMEECVFPLSKRLKGEPEGLFGKNSPSLFLVDKAPIMTAKY